MGVGEGARQLAQMKRAASIATRSFQDIRTAMENISLTFASIGSLTKNLSKMRGVLGNTGGQLFRGAGASIQGVSVSRNQANDALLTRESTAVSEFAGKNILKLVDQIKKSQAVVGDDALARLESAANMFIGGDIEKALEMFSQFESGSKSRNQEIQSLVDSLKTQFNAQKTNFEVERALNKSKFDLEEKRAQNLFNEKTLQNAQRDVLFERQKLFLQEQTQANRDSIRDRERLADPRTFRGRRGASRLALRQNIERGIAERDFGIQQRGQLEEDLSKVASAQVAEQQLKSRLELISTQKTLADKIEDLTFEMQKSRDVTKAVSIREQRILFERQNKARTLNTAANRTFLAQKGSATSVHDFISQEVGNANEIRQAAARKRLKEQFPRKHGNMDTTPKISDTFKNPYRTLYALENPNATETEIDEAMKNPTVNPALVMRQQKESSSKADLAAYKEMVRKEDERLRKRFAEIKKEEEKRSKLANKREIDNIEKIRKESASEVKAINSRKRGEDITKGLSPVYDISGGLGVEVQAARNKVRQQSGSQRVFAIERQSHDLATEALRTAKSTEDSYKILNGLKKTGSAATNEENILFNANIEKIRQQIELGQIKLVNTKKEADLERDLLFTRQEQLDEEARSFKQSMGAGFDELFQDIDYIYGRLGKDLPKQFRDGMVQALETSMDKAESFGDAMRGFAVDFLKIIRRASLEYSMSNFTSLIGMGVSSDFRERMVHEQRGGLIHARNGMYISDGAPSGDSVPAMLEKGEYVLNRKAVSGMGGKAALDSVNFGMYPRQGGGSMMLNEIIRSPRMSGLFLASDNPELAEEREKAAERERRRQEKRAEKDAMKRQFLSTLLSTAATTAMTGFSNFAQGRMQDAKAAKAVETASGGKLTKSGNFISGYNIEGSDADVAAFRAQSTFTPTQAKALGLDTSAGAVKIPKAMTRVLNKTIDNRMAEIMGGKDVMRDFYKGTSASQSRVDFLTQQGVDASNMNTVKDKMSFMDFLRSKRKGGGRMAGGYMNKDSMPAYLSEGEYVMNNKAVRKYGLGFMGRLNGGVIPGFQEGGPVGGGANTAPLSSGMGATTNNISINVSVGGGGGGQQASNSGNQNADQTSNKDDATQGKELGEKIRAKVLEVISEEQRLGGSLSKTKRQG